MSENKEFEKCWRDKSELPYILEALNTPRLTSLEVLAEHMFNAGRSSRWTKGVPEHKRGCFLLKVRPAGFLALHIIRAFYMDEGTPLDPGFYENAALYAEKGICYSIPEKDIVEWQYLPEM